MAYELATIADSAGPVSNMSPGINREEMNVNSFTSADTRLANAIAKLQGKPIAEMPKNNAGNISEVVTDEPVTSGGSLPLSPQLAALARKEQKLRQDQKALKASELAIQKERQEYAELKRLKEKIAAGDYSEAEKLIDYEKFTQAKLGRDPRTEELEKVRSEIAELKANQDKDVEDRFKSAVQQRRTAVKELIAKDDTFKAIKTKKVEEAVVQHILDTWEEDEIELSPEEAAQDIEKELKARAKEWASLIEEEVVAEPVVEKKELPPLKTGMKTLTNNMAATGEIKRPMKPLHMMTDTERYAEARRRYEDKLAQGIR